MDWLTAHIGQDDVQIHSLTNDQTILVVAGPKARAVMQTVSREDWSAKAFPWLSLRECFIGFSPATVMGVSFSGELAYEIHVPNASLFAVYSALLEAGKIHGMKLFGGLAVDSMRLEKGFLHWKADILTEFDPFETGLDRFVSFDKPDFIGRDALLKRKTPAKRLVTLQVDYDKAPAHGGASVMFGREVVGTVTSGGWGHRTGINLAYAFIVPEFSNTGFVLELDIGGTSVAAKVIATRPYDPGYSRMRS